MKKYFLSLLCVVGLYAESNLFLGVGGGYGFGSALSATGNAFTINNQSYASYKQDSVKFEGIIGFERYFSSMLGVRYYANVGHGFMQGRQDVLANTDVGANLDLIVRVPLSDSFGLRFFGGLNSAITILSGKLPTEFKKIFDQVQSGNLSNYEVSHSSFFANTSVNVGASVLLGTHHVIEVAGKIPVLGKDATLFSYRDIPSNGGAGGEKNKFLFEMPIDVTLRYIFVF